MEVEYKGKNYYVCGECQGLGEYLSTEGVIGEAVTSDPHCLNQWTCRNARECPMAVFTRGRVRRHNIDIFPESRKTG